MKKAVYALLLASFSSATAQKTSGVIEYEMTARMDMANAKIVIMNPGGARVEASPDNLPAGMPSLPDLITTKQTLIFSGGKGKLETEGGGGGFVMTAHKIGEGNAGFQSTVPVSDVAAAGTQTQSLRSSVSNTTYIDLERRKFLSVLKDTKDSTGKSIWFAEEDFREPAAIKSSEKTKTIAGYTCHKATVKLGDESFVVWYTTDIPLTFSPINGVLPDKGVVLSIESSKRSYVAKKIELKPVPEEEVSLPATAQKITSEELKEKRRLIMQRFQNEQLEKFQRATEGKQ